MFFCNGPLLQNILRGDRDGDATVKETFLRSRIYDLLETRKNIAEATRSAFRLTNCRKKEHSKTHDSFC